MNGCGLVCGVLVTKGSEKPPSLDRFPFMW